MKQNHINQIDDALPPQKSKKVVWIISILVFCLLSLFLIPSLLSEPPDQLLIKANAAYEQGKIQEALNYIQHVEPDGSVESIECVSLKGKLLVFLGQAQLGEVASRKVLKIDPQHIPSHMNLVNLLRLQGRNWELRPHFLEIIKQIFLSKGDQSMIPAASLIFPLRSVGLSEWVWLEPHELEIVDRCRRTVPRDYLIALGQARMAADANEFKQTSLILNNIIQTDPNQIEAQVQLGLILANSDTESEFLKWSQNIPESTVHHPEYWAALGSFAQKRDQPEMAIRCFGEALQLNPNHIRANYQISQLLIALEKKGQAKPFAYRANQLAQLEYFIKEVGSETSRIQDVAKMMESLGRPWEAAVWYKIGTDIFPRKEWPAKGLEKAVAGLTTKTPLNLVLANPVKNIDLSEYPLPKWDKTSNNHPIESMTKQDINVVWEETAESSGLNFSYQNGANSKPSHAYMFEFSGGGVAVIDYDHDAWPDIYLTQGGSWPSSSGGISGRNRLFRNQGNGSFVDVTTSTMPDLNDFSQGVCVSDFDNDGFPDLYVANIGGNRLLKNNGDGTYSDITDSTGTGGDDWTLSCVLADLNGDSLPDLYTVNYLSGQDVFDRTCIKNGRPVQCDPTMFSAAQDQLYQNSGDGRFKNITKESGIMAKGGKGMGIVVADFCDSRQLDIFIANDTTANFFFVNKTKPANESPQFTEEGLLRGLALGENGLAQSSMGVAAGDLMDDGLIDLFITNFSREPNNLYIHQSDHIFVDSARKANLYNSGFQYMSWGAQFLDGENDGLLDLVVANGDLEDLSDVGVRSLAPQVYYANLGMNRFKAVPEKQLGPYFQKKNLGRAIAKLDWNRDGLYDICVTHVDAPVALLTNRTVQHGHYLTVKLHGVQSSRDAIGTIVRIKTGDKIQTRQLIAGDGFQASNERRLQFGLGNHTQIDELTVSWPKGSKQTFHNLESDQELILVEGATQVYAIKADNR
ncbi:FG-GAP-like repeat-containing protein [uncultured Gimesia sp.]|uniref:FG-GAP-like repeat-containing protein n=1 Tax=uncultured Gimesia sp. TaxID=1678688 RepID=UPI00262637B1|nr:FG-GAP-like repeat-containing protein [uncultured Gimesia sp.]